MNIKLDIPENFYRGEEKCGYYVSPEMKKVWAVELDLIAEFARVCEKHNIKWYMDGGTLLGAVRHKGFIPWDDDVDVMLMRNDYERFCKIAPKEFSSPYYFEPSKVPLLFSKLCNESTTLAGGQSLRYIKAGRGKEVNKDLSIYIDIFPVDDIDDDEREFMKFYRQVKINGYLANKLYVCSEDYSPAVDKFKRPFKSAMYFIVQAIKALGIKIPYEYYYKKFCDLVKKSIHPGSKRVSKLVMIADPAYLKRRIWNRADFNDVVYLPFEMLTLPAPVGWENILNEFYGNWHKYFIRYKHGDFYDTEHPYTYYTKEGHLINEDSL